MEDIKHIISKNIVMLRKKSGMTQIELAERLNYSDKAVSKWERGESIPDIVGLKAIADEFSVTVDYLLHEEHPEDLPPDDCEKEHKKQLRHKAITATSVSFVWVLATIAFAILDTSAPSLINYMVFAYATAVSMLVWLVLNSIWHNRRRNYFIISGLMWSTLLSIYLSTLLGGHDPWQIFLLGIPGQIIILLWSSTTGRKS